jgi:putative flippase GtrA
MIAFRRLISFAWVGAVGYLVDLLVLLLLVHFFLFSVYWSRLPSFSTAVVVTWILNRNWTFSDVAGDMPKWREFKLYLYCQSIGMGINLFTYWFILAQVPWASSYPAFPLTIASVIAMLFNFFALNHWVFQKSK